MIRNLVLAALAIGASFGVANRAEAQSQRDVDRVAAEIIGLKLGTRMSAYDRLHDRRAYDDDRFWCREINRRYGVEDVVLLRYRRSGLSWLQILGNILLNVDRGTNRYVYREYRPIVTYRPVTRWEVDRWRVDPWRDNRWRNDRRWDGRGWEYRDRDDRWRRDGDRDRWDHDGRWDRDDHGRNDRDRNDRNRNDWGRNDRGQNDRRQDDRKKANGRDSRGGNDRNDRNRPSDVRRGA